MDLQLRDKAALVSGASQGIGRAIAKGLAREGAKVVLVARRRNLLEAVAAEIEQAGGHKPTLVDADLYDPETPARIAALAEQALGRIDILINAAGGSRPIPYDAPLPVWDEGMTLNFFRLRELTHAVLPAMQKNRFGRIVNITGSSEPRGVNVANAAKAAVHAWAKGLSKATHSALASAARKRALRDHEVFIENGPLLSGPKLTPRLLALGWSYQCAWCSISSWRSSRRSSCCATQPPSCAWFASSCRWIA